MHNLYGYEPICQLGIMMYCYIRGPIDSDTNNQQLWALNSFFCHIKMLLFYSVFFRLYLKVWKGGKGEEINHLHFSHTDGQMLPSVAVHLG